MDTTDPVTTVIRTVLVANRGEIALRVFRTCRRLGIDTVAVFTDLDVEAPHVKAADRALRVESYLDIDAVVAAALEAGADAIHPGYGFLSERSEFARAVEAAGVRLVGPTAEVMDRMGRKDHARAVAVGAGVPVVPSYDVDGDPETFAYPVLVKAAAGGGGKGMRIVRSADEFAAATAAAAREARSAFGDDTLLIEKYVESGRHLEVQVIGDTHGQVIHLFERDCSTQRRHQKVLEEAPGPTVDPALRHRLTAAAVALAQAAGYTNAGTVEFLLDSATGDFYFLEMNTRLQVEHPVTEAITGLDLVEEQLRIAAGAPLSLRQDDLMGIRGHAIEARVYAEDSFGGFLPQAGTTSLVRWPSGEGVRVDQALGSNQVVSTSYDPMLGKVIAHGPDRETARQALVRALDDTAILGLTTNAGFLRALVASDEFRDAAIDTAWLDHHELPAPSPDLPRIMAAWVSAMLATLDSGHPFQRDGFRLGGPPAPVVVELDRDVVVDRHLGTVDGTPVQMVSAEDHVLELVVDGHTERAVVNVQPDIVEVSYRGQRHVLTGPDRLADHVAVGDGTVVAPMPGTVLEVRVAAGERVEAGHVLGMMEAMKMELSLKAPFAGTVASAEAVVGAQVALGATLFVVEPDDEGAGDG
ncbi:acetyl/propionyl/methylcrotonyl-CoA carboxylase subunit alpha [Nocardioides cynanchi]|uniref:acetyl/propionyl/methylcrotonyl-CoA carboxylase subunit alpha n=1 Tax=Nocardioides cynanchi TaxID=2558918 RepID=UPI001248EE88|nr:biotin carboxylase N-terminal domain-containing protein [Nocardioides cynanchi]